MTSRIPKGDEIGSLIEGEEILLVYPGTPWKVIKQYVHLQLHNGWLLFHFWQLIFRDEKRLKVINYKKPFNHHTERVAKIH